MKTLITIAMVAFLIGLSSCNKNEDVTPQVYEDGSFDVRWAGEWYDYDVWDKNNNSIEYVNFAGFATDMDAIPYEAGKAEYPGLPVRVEDVYQCEELRVLLHDDDEFFTIIYTINGVTRQEESYYQSTYVK